MFNKGDKVVCVQPWLGWLTVGMEYTVEEESNGYVRVVGNSGIEGGFAPERFQLVNRPSVKHLTGTIQMPAKRKKA